MLNEHFVPVAIDQWYERRQKDTKGDFYRKIAGQGPRNDFEKTTQGHYACTASGDLLGFNANHVDLSRLKTMLRKAVEKFDPESYKNTTPIKPETIDAQFEVKPPAGGLVVRVYSKILDGYDEPQNGWQESFQKSTGRDNLWIKAEEKNNLINVAKNGGSVPDSIGQRIARFHLADNTRGEPPRWAFDEIKHLELTVKNGIIRGSVSLATKDGKRGYNASLYGHIEVTEDELSRFEMVAEGKFWGQGRFTSWGPKGKFPLVIAFKLADGKAAEHLAIPHGAKGWVEGYYETVK